ncbi:MAG: hypothetical protein MI685_05645 [Chlorobiales bacterium]|nr:hypothetical protein [Chlorobiales bacterium]
MLNFLIKEIQKLSISVEFLNENDAKTILEITNEKIQDKTNALIVDLLVKKQGQKGVILDPLVSTHEKSKRGAAKGKEITSSSSGVWDWVYKYKSPLWLENIISLNKENKVINKLNRHNISKKYLDFWHETDGILVIPLFRGENFMGIYSIEFPEYIIIKKETVGEIIELSKSVATLLWKVEVQNQINEDSSSAISHFRNAIFDETFEKTLDEYRSGFFARPFDVKYEGVENYIKEFFGQKKILVKSFVHKPHEEFVVSDIRNQIESSHFGIIDISECNPNVMIELGMMKAFHKKVILLLQKDDDTKIPFDLAPFEVYKYEFRTDEISVVQPRSSQMKTIDDFLNSFINMLLTFPAFQRAKPYLGQAID